MVSILDHTFLTPIGPLDEPPASLAHDSDSAPAQTPELLATHKTGTSEWCAQADTASSTGTTSKWSKILKIGTCAFVPVKRYSVAQLLSLRPHASADAEVDVDHIENSIVSARQRAAFQSPLPIVQPLFVPLFVPHQPVKEHREHTDSDSARSSSPTVAQSSSEDETEKEKEQSNTGKKVHRSRRGGKRHPNKTKKLAQEAESQPAQCSVASEESEQWPTVDAVRENKHRASSAALAAKHGEAFSSAVMRRRRLQAKERGGK